MTLIHRYLPRSAALLVVTLTAAAAGLAPPNHAACAADLAKIEAEHAAWAEGLARWNTESAHAETDLHAKVAAIVRQIEALSPAAPGHPTVDGPATHPDGSPAVGQ